jgi:hypothetical protein
MKNFNGNKKIVFFGMMTKIPVAGAVWGTVQYLIGFQRLGYDVYYVEAHGRTPSMLMKDRAEDSSGKAAAYIANIMKRFDLSDRWAFHALHDDGRCYGLSEGELQHLYDSAELLINYHGGTVPLPEHSATGRLVYLETDPVELEIELYDNVQESIDFLRPHRAFFTWGLNYGQPDCKVPLPEGLHFRTTCPPVVLDLWHPFRSGPAETFTTIGNWRQPWREVTFQGEVYHWSKHFEFLKFLDLPQRTEQTFELGLSASSYTEDDKQMLEDNDWKLRDALGFSTDLDSYREYIVQSRGEFTVAKDQNVRLRSGWFSERSAQYLAAGRPVITQETGFCNVLPTGEGLFGFSTMDEILGAVDKINSNYERHCQAAYEIAQEYFSYEVVLNRLLDDVGL